MILFICTTEFQLFSILNICKSFFEDKKIDIYIYGEINRAKYIKKKAEKSGIFNKIKIIKFKKVKIKIIHVLKIRMNIKQYLDDNNECYESVFLGGPDIRGIIIFDYFQKINLKCKLCFYEEGIFEYYLLNGLKNNWKKLFYKLFFGYIYLDVIDTLYVFEPKIIIQGTRKRKTKKILLANKSFLTKIFDENIEYKDKKIIFLETFFPDKKNTLNQKNIIEKLFNEFGKVNFAVKLHPASLETTYNAIKLDYLQNINFEIIGLKQTFENKVFFSCLSSAAILPKIIFDEEPYVIMLYRLFDSKVDDELDKVFCNVQNEYKNNKFFIPNNNNELKQVLERIKEDI